MSLAFIPFWASMKGLRGMLVIFIHEVVIVVSVCIPVAYALKAFQKNNGLFRFDD